MNKNEFLDILSKDLDCTKTKANTILQISSSEKHSSYKFFFINQSGKLKIQFLYFFSFLSI